MSKTGGNFFEEHVEKIVLGIVGLVCVWLLVTRVLFSPNKVPYDGRKLGPGEIDPDISKQAENLERERNRKPEPKQPYEARFGEFAAMVESTIGNIDAGVYPPKPNHLTEEGVRAVYDLPVVGEVNGVAVEYIRAVAYVPTEEIDEKSTYDVGNHEPNDIDFVTVEGKFDVAGLCKRFYESFAGEDVREEWRDPCLGRPIFAAVQLQRRQLGADGRWGNWQDLPRTKIDHRKKTFEIIERVEGLPMGGMKVRLLQFDNPRVIMDLLQPEAYAIASAGEEWFPPSLHKEYEKHQRQVEAKKKREAREAERKAREREEGRTEQSGIGFGARDHSPRGMGYRPRGAEGFRGGATSRERPIRGTRDISIGGNRSDSRREGRRLPTVRKSEKRTSRSAKTKEIPKKKTVSDFYDEYRKSSITEETDLAKMREPLLFWAHDDTVGPGKSYQYRIRLGVFNPIAGTNQFSERDKLQKNKVILWSEFADAKETVEIPERLYFFPLDIQEAAKVVTVKVSKYVLGYWYGQKFKVKQGEVIGKVVESEAGEEEGKLTDTVPETINYTTGAVLVDAVRVSDWSGTNKLRSRLYHDMLYSFDGTNIEHTPIKRSYWPKELQSRFSDIEKLEKEERVPPRPWADRFSRGERGPGVGVSREEKYDYEEERTERTYTTRE